MTKSVFVQNWEESKRGWGTRPDGFTIHSSKEQLDEYVAWFYKTYNNLPTEPDEYTRTAGDPIEMQVDDALWDRIDQATQRQFDGRTMKFVSGDGRFIKPTKTLEEKDIHWPRGYGTYEDQ